MDNFRPVVDGSVLIDSVHTFGTRGWRPEIRQVWVYQPSTKSVQQLFCFNKYQVSIDDRLFVHNFSGMFNNTTLMVMLHVGNDMVQCNI